MPKKPIVAKEARMVGEVNLDKEIGKREETIRETVRHTEVYTAQLSGTDTTYPTDNDKL